MVAHWKERRRSLSPRRAIACRRIAHAMCKIGTQARARTHARTHAIVQLDQIKALSLRSGLTCHAATSIYRTFVYTSVWALRRKLQLFLHNYYDIIMASSVYKWLIVPSAIKNLRGCYMNGIPATIDETNSQIN